MSDNISEINNGDKGWREWSMHILKELDRLNRNYQSLSEELQEVNKHLTRVEGMKHAINDLKEWKKDFEEVVTIKDIEDIKSKTEKNERFKTQLITIGGIIQLLIGLFIAFKDKLFN